MEPSIPEWLGKLLYAALGGLGALGLGLIKAWIDSKKIRTDDRTEFTQQIMQRLQAVEASAQAEREHCEARISELHRVHENQLRIRDELNSDLRDRIERLEGR